MAFDESGVQNYDSDLKNWQSISKVYDENGDLTGSYTLFDNGVEKRVETDMQGEVRTTKLDHSDVFEWSQIDKLVDQDGDRIGTSYIFDNGDLSFDLFEYDARILHAFVDGSDSRSWYGYIQVFDENGDRLSTVYYDTEAEFYDATEIFTAIESAVF